MAFNRPTIATIEDYKNLFGLPESSTISDTDLQNILYIAQDDLNVLTNGNIYARWDETDASNPLFLDEQNKFYISQALLRTMEYYIQTGHIFAETTASTGSSSYQNKSDAFIRLRTERQDIIGLLRQSGTLSGFVYDDVSLEGDALSLSNEQLQALITQLNLSFLNIYGTNAMQASLNMNNQDIINTKDIINSTGNGVISGFDTITNLINLSLTNLTATNATITNFSGGGNGNLIGFSNFNNTTPSNATTFRVNYANDNDVEFNILNSATGTQLNVWEQIRANVANLLTKQNTLTAGTGINITNDVISATTEPNYWNIETLGANKQFQNDINLYTGATPQVNLNIEHLGELGKSFYADKITGLAPDQIAEFLQLYTILSTATTTPYYVANIRAIQYFITNNGTEYTAVNPILKLGGYDIDANFVNLYLTEILRNYSVTAGAIPVLPLITQLDIDRIADNTTQINANQAAIANKQDELIAGTNITINNNVISAIGGSGGNSYWAIAGQTFQNLESIYTGANPIENNYEYVGRFGKIFIAKKLQLLNNEQNANFLLFNTAQSQATNIPYYVINILAQQYNLIQNDNTTLQVKPLLKLTGYDIDENLAELYITEILKNYDVTGGVIPVLPLITQAQVNQIGTNTTNINDNATDIATNIADINTNTTNIATNTGKIATNESDIAANENQITNNRTEISKNTSLSGYRLLEFQTINLPTNNYVNFSNFIQNPILTEPLRDITITNNDTLTFTEENASYLIKINHNVGSFLQFESNNQQNFQSVKNNINQLFVAPIGLTDGYLEIYLNTGSTTNTTLKMVSRSFNLAIDNVTIERVPTQPFNNYEWFKDINKGILFTKQSLSSGNTPIELFVASKLFTPTTTFTGYTFNSNNTITLPAGYRYRIEVFDTGTVGGGNAVEWTITETQNSTTNTFTTDGSSTKTLIITTSNNQIRLTYGTNATAYGNHDINYNIIVLGRTF